MEIILKVTENDANTILLALQELPHKQSNEVIVKVLSQAEAQTEAARVKAEKEAKEKAVEKK